MSFLENTNVNASSTAFGPMIGAKMTDDYYNMQNIIPAATGSRDRVSSWQGRETYDSTGTVVGGNPTSPHLPVESGAWITRSSSQPGGDSTLNNSEIPSLVPRLPIPRVRRMDGSRGEAGSSSYQRSQSLQNYSVYRDVELDGVMTPMSGFTVNHVEGKKSRSTRFRERSVISDKDQGVESHGWWQQDTPRGQEYYSALSVSDADDESPDHISMTQFGDTRCTARWPWHRHAVGQTMSEEELIECITSGIRSVIVGQRKEFAPVRSSLKRRLTANFHEFRGTANEMRGKIGHLFDLDIVKEKFIKDPHTPFDFAAYAPRAFRKLREIHGISEEQYVDWLCSSPLVGINTPSAGKSQSLFWYSHDRRFILKSLTQEETSTLRGFIGKYTKHLQTDNPNSLLGKFYGLYKLTIHGNMTIRFIVMGNVFHGPPQDRMFDLKGTTEDRLVRVDASEGDGKVMMKDLNFTESFCMIPQVADLFMDAVRKDVDFLCSFGLMDYSLIVGIRELPREEDPMELDVNNPFTTFHGGIQGWSWEDGSTSATSLVYSIGIIDFLQLWTGWKTVAHLMKKITIGCCHEIDTEPPHVYRARFLRYVNSKTMKIPTFQKIFMENTLMKHRLQILEDENSRLRKMLGLGNWKHHHNTSERKTLTEWTTLEEEIK